MTDLVIDTEVNTKTYYSYTGTGPLSFYFAYLDSADLYVKVNGVLLSAGAWTDTPNVVDGGYDGGSITLASAVSAATVEIGRDTRRLRGTQFGSGGATPRAIDEEFNRIVLMEQDTNALLQTIIGLASLTDAQKADLATVAAAINDGTLADLLDGQLRIVTSRVELKSLDPAIYPIALLLEGGRSGLFRVVSGDFSARVTADTVEGIYLALDGVATTSKAWVRVIESTINPAWFGVAADYDPATDTGTDDYAACKAMLDTVITMGGIHPVMMPAGDLKWSSKYTYSANANIKLRWIGAGEGGTQIYLDYQDSATNGGVSITCTGATKFFDVRCSDIRFVARDTGQVSTPTDSSTINKMGTAWHFERNPVPGNRDYGELTLERCATNSYNNLEAHFDKDFHIVGLRKVKMVDCYAQCLLTATTLSDAYDNSWAPYAATYSAHIVDCYGFRAYDCEFRGGAQSMFFTSTGTTEGGLFVNCTWIWGKTSVLKGGTSNEPAFSILGGHMNYRDYGLYVDYGKTGTIQGVLLYNNNDSLTDGAATPIDILLKPTSGDQWSIIDNRMFFDDNPFAANREFCRTEVASAKIYYLRGNKIGNGAVYKYGFKATAAKHIVYANDNEFDTATTGATTTMVPSESSSDKTMDRMH